MAIRYLASPRKRILRVGLLLALLVVLIFQPVSHPAFAQSQPNTLIITAEAGYEGHVKDGTWMPVWITLENTGPDLQGSLELIIGKDQDIYTYPILMPTTSRKEVVVYLFVYGYSRILDIRYKFNDSTIAKTEVTLTIHAATDKIFGVMSDTASAYNVLTQLQPSMGSVYVVEIKPGHLPDRLHALQTLDALIISNFDTSGFSPTQVDAMSSWIAGGRWLVVTGGADWQKTAAGFQDSKLFPIRPDHSVPLNELTSVEQFAGVVDPLEIEMGKLLAAAGALAPDAQVLLSENQYQNSLPLIIRRAHGLGSVTYLSFDPSQPPLRNWSGAEAFFERLFSSSTLPPFWTNGIQNWDNAITAAQTLPNLTIPSPIAVCAFLAVYLVAIGPLNFFLLSRIKRRVWSWVTIPGIVIICSLIVFLAGGLSRGNQAILNELAVVQVWSGIDKARVDGLVGLFSPSRSLYDVSVQSPALLHPIRQSSMMTQTNYTIHQDGEQVKIHNIRAEISGIIPLAYETFLPAPAIGSTLEIQIDEQGVYLDGSISNNSELDLENAVLLIPGSSVHIGNFAPGDTMNIHSALNQAQLAEDFQILTSAILPPTASQKIFTGYPYYPYDTTISEIIGTANYYDDRENLRRYMLVESMVNYSYANMTRGQGITLSGWYDGSPLEIGINREHYKTQENTLYLISFPMNFQLAPGELKLTPGIFNWQLIEGQDINYSPYSAYLFGSNFYSLTFKPAIPIQIKEVKSLSVDLDASGLTGTVKELNLFLFDFLNEEWHQMTDVVWGSNPIESPAPYIAEDGTIWLRIESTPASNYGLQITRSDVTLVVVQK